MPEALNGRQGTVLAFDFGEKRIGVAVGEWQLLQAHPLTTLHAAANAERFAAIAALIDEWRPVSLVVGRPLSLDGAAHVMTARCARFANQLRGRYRLPVEDVDERYSSVEADAGLRERGLSWQERKARVDAEAALIILQSWSDSHANAPA